MPGTTIPRGNVLAQKIFSITITPAQVSANTTGVQTFTVVGLAVGDYINCSSASAQTAGIIIGNCRVSGTNQLEIQFGNFTGGALTPVSGVYGCAWGRSENSPLPTDAS
jgi:hypothetical protein